MAYFKVQYQHLSGGPEEKYENFSENSQSCGQDLNAESPSFEGEILTNAMQCLVLRYDRFIIFYMCDVLHYVASYCTIGIVRPRYRRM
jgi:hypothetical protein